MAFLDLAFLPKNPSRESSTCEQQGGPQTTFYTTQGPLFLNGARQITVHLACGTIILYLNVI